MGLRRSLVLRNVYCCMAVYDLILPDCSFVGFSAYLDASRLFSLVIHQCQVCKFALLDTVPT